MHVCMNACVPVLGCKPMLVRRKMMRIPMLMRRKRMRKTLRTGMMEMDSACSLSLSLARSVCLSLSYAHTHSLTHTRAHTPRAHTHTHTHTHEQGNPQHLRIAAQRDHVIKPRDQAA